MDKKRSIPVLAYLPAFSFTLAYFFYQYLISGISITVSPVGTVRAFIVFFVILVIFGFVAFKIIKDHTRAGLALWLAAELFLFSQKYFIISGILAVVVVLLLGWVNATAKEEDRYPIRLISFDGIGFWIGDWHGIHEGSVETYI